MLTYVLISVIASMGIFIAWLLMVNKDLKNELFVKSIKKQLKKAVKSENYELAAVLRDKINRI